MSRHAILALRLRQYQLRLSKESEVIVMYKGERGFRTEKLVGDSPTLHLASVPYDFCVTVNYNLDLENRLDWTLETLSW